MTASRRKIRTLIVDDEPLARRNLALLLTGDAEIELLPECASARAAVQRIRDEKPELLFLDVRMPEQDGFGVLEALGTSLPTAIVFVTAYDEYALRAFDAGALDYLLKPFDDERFARALERAKEKLAAHAAIRSSNQGALAVKTSIGIELVKLSDIDWIEASDYYASLHVGRRALLLRRSLAALARELDATAFFRIHRSTIVNVERVRALELNQAGEYDIVLHDGQRLRLSRRYRKLALQRWGARGAVTS